MRPGPLHAAAAIGPHEGAAVTTAEDDEARLQRQLAQLEDLIDSGHELLSRIDHAKAGPQVASPPPPEPDPQPAPDPAPAPPPAPDA